MEPHGHTVKLVAEGISLAIIAGTIAKILPAIASVLSIVWYGVLLYDRFKNRPKKTTNKG